MEEVYCSIYSDKGADLVQVRSYAPYKGWGAISGELRRQVGELRPPAGLCTLWYTDRFNAPVDLQPDLNPAVRDRILCQDGGEYGVTLTMNQANGRILHQVQDRDIWFTFTIRSEPWLVPGSQIGRWFDDAHAEIHALFDLAVPDTLIKSLI